MDRLEVKNVVIARQVMIDQLNISQATGASKLNLIGQKKSFLKKALGLLRKNKVQMRI